MRRGIILLTVLGALFWFFSSRQAPSTDPTSDESYEQWVEAEDPNLNKVISSMRAKEDQKNKLEQKQLPKVVLSNEFDFLDDRIKHRVNEVVRLQNCYYSDECSSKVNPSQRGSHYDLALSMKWQIVQMAETLKSFPELKTPEIEDFSRSVLGFPADHVREAALKLISLFPKSHKNLDAVTLALEESRNQRLFEAGMGVLTDYSKYSSFDDSLVPFLKRQVLSDSGGISQAVVNGIYPFLNEVSYPELENSLGAMNKRSKAYKTLKAQLKQYRYLNPDRG